MRCGGRRIRRRGFTLIEVISSSVVLAALASVAASILFVATDGYVEASASSQLHSEASIVLDRLVREFRGIELDPTASGVAPDIETVTTNIMVWNDNDFIIWSGDRVYLRKGTSPARAMIDNVTKFRIRVFDESDTILSLPRSAAACDPIRRIEITLVVERSGVTETVRTKQFVRCTMSRAGLP